MTDIIEVQITICDGQQDQKASKILAVASGLPQAKLKEAMHKGAVWLRRGKGQKRLRRAGKALRVGDELLLNYNPRILDQWVPEPQLVSDLGDYSIWFKPFGLACQGSRWGDFSAMARWVEVNLPEITDHAPRPVHLVHRLDRATTGLMILCHSKRSARAFSELFAAGQVDKRYQAIVRGDFSVHGSPLQVNKPVDGKEATTVFSLASQSENACLLDVQLLTGRKHQIRKHLRGLDFPIIGDRLYGEGEQDGIDLHLQAVSLSFTCPMTGESRAFVVRDDQRLILDQII
ncbi:RluA family pseudouridine synthase [Marinicella sediminis]|uniref:RluA family pseudouridine synthase n=1 Tax=Marinicella sediminis TaxID=1792834 RepID=A0ABV7J584_9GAMM|nr:RluA family pseudouridine synthase [Marinicella sediminis]